MKESGSGSGSVQIMMVLIWRFKNIRIRIHNTGILPAIIQRRFDSCFATWTFCNKVNYLYPTTSILLCCGSMRIRIFCQSGSGSRVLVTIKIVKKLQLKKKYIFWSKMAFTYPLVFINDVRTTEEVFIPHKKTSSTLKLEISSLLWVIFALLHPDPHSQCGSGSSRPKWMRIWIHISSILCWRWRW